VNSDKTGAVGLDFGTTNSVVALAGSASAPQLVEFASEHQTTAVFRSALCFWEDEDAPRGIGCEAGPWAIAEYLRAPSDSRFLQSFKTVAANPLFDRATIFNKPFAFEDLGQYFLRLLVHHAGGQLDDRPRRVIVGRPVEYAGAQPDPALARRRYDAMLQGFGTELHYVYEPLAAAFSYAARLAEPATVLVADFGGGTTDFSVVRVAEPGATQRCTPLGAAGIGIAGDRFDQRIVDNLVLPMLGKGGQYRSFDKTLDIPGGWFADFGDWSRLALMRNRRTLDELRRLQRTAIDPVAIGRMINFIEHEQGFALYDAVGRLKRALSTADRAEFQFDGGGLDIVAEVRRTDFETWIAPDLQRIETTLNTALARAGLDATAIDRVFLTGGSSLIPAVRAMFDARFGEQRIATGSELTSIAHGLALVGAENDLSAWVT
jgi:hypothetical chaperone protein